MTEADQTRKNLEGVQVSAVGDVKVAAFDDAWVEVSADGKTVDAYAPNGFIKKIAAASASEGTHISDDFNEVVLNGVAIARAEGGKLQITVPEGAEFFGHTVTDDAPIVAAAAAVTTDEARKALEGVHVSAVDGATVVAFGDSRVEISADGKTVDAYNPKGARKKLAADGEAPAAGTQISDDFNTMVIKGITIARTENGPLEITVPKDVELQGHVVANEPVIAAAVAVAPIAEKPPLKPGDRDEDGWVLVCKLKDGSQLFLAPRDAGRMSLARANRRAYRLEIKGIDGAHVPTGAEMSAVRRNLAAIGGLEKLGLDPNAFYLTSFVRTQHRYPTDGRAHLPVTDKRFRDKGRGRAYKAVDSQRLGDGSWDTKGKVRSARQVRFVKIVKPA